VFAVDEGKSEVLTVVLSKAGRTGKSASFAGVAYSRDDVGTLATTLKTLRVTKLS
jgi:hypothetical protein